MIYLHWERIWPGIKCLVMTITLTTSFTLGVQTESYKTPSPSFHMSVNDLLHNNKTKFQMTKSENSESLSTPLANNNIVHNKSLIFPPEDFKKPGDSTFHTEKQESFPVQSTLSWAQLTTATALVDNEEPFPGTINESFQFFFRPQSINGLIVHSLQTVVFNCTSTTSKAGLRYNFNSRHIPDDISHAGSARTEKDEKDELNPTRSQQIDTHGNPKQKQESSQSSDRSYVSVTPLQSAEQWSVSLSSTSHVPIPYSFSSSINSNGLSATQENFQFTSTSEPRATAETTTTTTSATATRKTSKQNISAIKDKSKKRKKYLVLIRSNNDKILKIHPSDSESARTTSKYAIRTNQRSLQNELPMYIYLNENYNFTVEAMHIGYVTMSVTLMDTQNQELIFTGRIKTLASAEYPASVIRQEKVADTVFDCSAAAVAILISFGIGCVTDKDSLKQQMKYPVSLLVGFCCQFLLMPMLAFGISLLLKLDSSICFGLFCVACVPGGGLGHVAVIISHSDIPLSLAMNLISIMAMLGTAPMWIFALGKYFQATSNTHIAIPIQDFEIWLCSTFFSYITGLVINRFKPNVADALLTWLIKPLLLLATILYITLGVYINMYVFDGIETHAVLASILLPVSGFVLTFCLLKIFRQKHSFCKSAALECSSFNCLIVLAAIRFSLPKPLSDIASEIPMWVMFTIPGMYVLLAILRVFKNCVGNFMESRKQQKFRNFSIASGIVNQANMAALSAPLFVTEATDEDQNSVSEKITVL